MKDIYIHYGSTHFRPEAFKTPRNQNWVKPIGGLWACLKNDERAYTWKDWNESEGFTDCCEDTSFSFTLKDTANVHYIYNSIDLKDILHEYPVGTSLITSYIDFEDLVKRGIDAIELRSFGKWEQSVSREHLYFALYGWDCDCILILNPDCIEKEW